jgi:hypothetical protein
MTKSEFLKMLDYKENKRFRKARMLRLLEELMFKYPYPYFKIKEFSNFLLQETGLARFTEGAYRYAFRPI